MIDISFINLILIIVDNTSGFEEPDNLYPSALDISDCLCLSALDMPDNPRFSTFVVSGSPRFSTFIMSNSLCLFSLVRSSNFSNSKPDFLKLNFVNLCWYRAFWVVTLIDKKINYHKMPFFLTGQGCYY